MINFQVRNLNLMQVLILVNGVVCYCEGYNCPNDLPNGTCLAQPGSQCFSAVEDVYNHETSKMEPERSFGCLPPDEQGFMQVIYYKSQVDKLKYSSSINVLKNYNKTTKCIL